ncbi:MAG: ATP-binding cassette domain-containing protein [Ruminococcaceae bacterium]|nr:ATP-binding cassette domain-containing protein [Oscillospiraceae bacterium]
MESIKIENLSFTYPVEEKYALYNINLTIEQGEFITICGKSGCGKSTLLRLLKPILAPQGKKQGTIYLAGKDVTTLSQKEQAEKIGFVFQNPDNQIVTDKVWHELAFGLESLSYSKSEIRARVSEMASFFGIGEWFHKKVTDLSGGQKQLLNVASVMVMQPSLLVLDEPTSQLDPIAAGNFLETVKKINREFGVTVVLTEHRLEDAFPLSDRVIVMKDGNIIADDIPQKVGEVLHRKEDDMFFALPTPMRVYYSKKDEGICPITVRDARKWLSCMPLYNNIQFADKKRTKNNTVLTLSDVWFRYEKDLPDVLKGLSLSVQEGEWYALVGSNGSGKTTALSVILGLEKQYRGKVQIAENKKIVALPQNPQSLFMNKTVELDLYEMLSNTKMTKEQTECEIQAVIDFCELHGILNRHPYDLSGGEQQRVALAQVLLEKPDILLLDEPTKGLDAHFKVKLAKMLQILQKSGVTIVMVSHDIEFCAKFACRCGMFFDGAITSEDIPRKFFSGKAYYTTSANRMARDIVDGAVLDEDIMLAIGGEIKEQHDVITPIYSKNKHKESCKIESKKKLTLKNVLFGTVFAFLFLLMQFMLEEQYNGPYGYIYQIVSILLLGLSLINFIPRRKNDVKNVQLHKNKRKIPKRTAMAAFIILLLIPLTVFVGFYCLGNRKYYLISLLIILETLLPFFLVFEGRKPQAREIVMISVLCAIAVAGRTAFFMLPQFKPVIAIVIIVGVCFGGESGFLVGAITGFVSNFFFGQTPFTYWQMFAFGIIGFLAGVLFRKGLLRKTKTELCIFGFLATLILYGGIINFASVILWQPNPTKEMFLTGFAMGFPYDLVHAIGTAFFLYFITEPMIEKLDRIKEKYGFME